MNYRLFNVRDCVWLEVEQSFIAIHSLRMILYSASYARFSETLLLVRFAAEEIIFNVIRKVAAPVGREQHNAVPIGLSSSASSIMLWICCRAMLCITAAYAVVRCLSVRPSCCLSHSHIESKRVIISSKTFFSQWGSYRTTYIIICTKPYDNIQTATPPPNRRHWIKVGCENRYFRPKSCFIGYCQQYDCQVSK